MGDRVASVAKEAQDSAASAREKALSETRKSAASLAANLAQERQVQQEVAGQLDQLKQAHSSTASKVEEMGGDLNGVKGDLTSVKGDVTSAKGELQAHGTELKRMTGDMGMMSGLIATNAKQLTALRELGERDYVEFDLKKSAQPQNVGGLQLALSKADVKRNRFTLNVIADDKKVEKRDRTINEPVQLYLAAYRQPVEIVVNDVKKDEVVGYVAMPKVAAPRK